jgi:hypothetical protein
MLSPNWQIPYYLHESAAEMGFLSYIFVFVFVIFVFVIFAFAFVVVVVFLVVVIRAVRVGFEPPIFPIDQLSVSRLSHASPTSQLLQFRSQYANPYL